jgi:hypothetical protein
MNAGHLSTPRVSRREFLAASAVAMSAAALPIGGVAAQPAAKHRRL